jgi:hypothetical protein
MELQTVAADIAAALAAIDGSQVPFKQFQPGVGPYGEPQLTRLIAAHLDKLPRDAGLVATKRTCSSAGTGRWSSRSPGRSGTTPNWPRTGRSTCSTRTRATSAPSATASSCGSWPGRSGGRRWWSGTSTTRRW